MKHKFSTILLTLITAFCLCFSLVACDNGGSGSGNSGSGGNGSTTEQGGNGGTTKPDEHVHSFTDYVYNNDATCTEDGTETATCTCGVSDTRTKKGTKTGHQYTVENVCDVCGDQLHYTEGLEYTYVDGESSKLLTGDDMFADSYMLTGIGSAVGDIVIPSGYRGKWVTLTNTTFEQCTSVTFPDSVVIIGNQAFNGNKTIESITIGNGAIYVPGCHGCTNLKHVTIGKQIKSILDSTFMNCTSLKEISLPEGMVAIGREAFGGCTALENIHIPDSVTQIDIGAFSTTAYYNDVKNWDNGVLYIDNHLIEAKKTVSGTYSVREGTKNIATQAFNENQNLTTVRMPDSVATIGERAFYSCQNLHNVVFGSGLISIGREAFSNCYGLTEVQLPDGVTSIGGSAFFCCSGLKSIVIPDSVTTIGFEQFYSCTSLESVTIPADVTEIAMEAFYGCSSLKNIYFKGTRTQWDSITKGTGWDSETGDYTLITDWTGGDSGQTGGDSGQTGGSGQTGSGYKTQWESDSLLSLLPFPTFGTCTGITGMTNNKGATFTGATQADLRSYIALIESTFGYNVSSTNNSYMAYNTAGTIRVTLGYASGNFTVLVTKL